MTPKKRSTFRRIGGWTAVVLTALFVVAAIQVRPLVFAAAAPGLPGAQDSRVRQELDKRLQALKAQGMPLSMAEAAPKAVPDDQNAAVLYGKAMSIWKNPAGLTPYEKMELDIYVGNRMPGPPEAPRASSPDSPPPPPPPPGAGPMPTAPAAAENYPPGPTSDARARELFSRPSIREVLEDYRAGSLLPYCVFPVKWENGSMTTFPQLAKMRSAGRFLGGYVRLLASEGKMAEALQWSEVTLRMSQQLASEPTLIPFLVGTALQAMVYRNLQQVMMERPVSPAEVQDFERFLSKMDLTASLTQPLITERAQMIGEYDLFRRDTGRLRDKFQAANVGEDSEVPPLVKILSSKCVAPIVRSLLRADEVLYLDYMQQGIELSAQPYREGKPRLEQLENTVEEQSTWQSPLFGLSISPQVIAKTLQKRDQNIAQIGLMRVALALKGYKYEHHSYPASLDELQQTLSWKLPRDPFSGKPFLYLTEGEAFKVYSIGPDLQDDGGIPINRKTKVHEPAVEEWPRINAMEPDDIIWESLI